ncbi:GTP-binding protein Rheb-like [Pyxicephalus adspersus]|uniref:GTP-binding protein Rheb-like n=1 Tax=Pyxicephalus adspersus TaxID=30357 RepID=UPI003B5C4015
MFNMTKYRKVVVLGHRGVGKTSLTLQFIKEEFPQDYKSSEDQYWAKIFSIDGVGYQLCVVDTRSQNELSFIRPSYVSEVDGYVIVYSVDSPRSMPVVLVGNKKDIPPDRHTVSPEEGRAVAELWNAPFMEVSAKDLEESRKVFCKIIEEIDGLNRPLPVL